MKNTLVRRCCYHIDMEFSYQKKNIISLTPRSLFFLKNVSSITFLYLHQIYDFDPCTLKDKSKRKYVRSYLNLLDSNSIKNN